MYTKSKLRRKQDPNKFEPIYAELENIYQINFAETEKKLNKRTSIAAVLLITATILLFLTLIQTIIIPNVLYPLPVIIAIILILLTPLTYLNQSNEETSFSRRFKELIIATLIKKFGKNLMLNPETIDKKTIIQLYKDLGYETSNLDFYSNVDDVIVGNLNNGKQIRMSEAIFRKSSGKNTVVIFGGLFIESNLSKSINDEIRVLLSGTELYNLGNCNKLELDNSEFEKIFNVYTKNKVVTAQILTSEVLERLTTLRTDYGMNFDFIIKGDKLYIRLEVGSMFETASQRNKLHKEDILIYYSILNYVDLLITELNKMVDEASI